MNLLRLMITLCLAGHPISALAQSEVRVRPVWWQSPSQPLQLYTEGADGKPKKIRVLLMCPLEAFKADRIKGATLLRLADADPADPKAKPKWTPYITAPLPAGSSDVLMLLLPNSDGTKSQARILPMDEDSLRWGSTRLVNFTTERLIGKIDGKPFAVAPGESTILPIVAERRTVVDVLIATESAKGQNLIFSSKGIFGPSKRTVLFVLNNTSGGYETRAIEEPNPNPNASLEQEPSR